MPKAVQGGVNREVLCVRGLCVDMARWGVSKFEPSWPPGAFLGRYLISQGQYLVSELRV